MIDIFGTVIVGSLAVLVVGSVLYILRQLLK